MELLPEVSLGALSASLQSVKRLPFRNITYRLWYIALTQLVCVYFCISPVHLDLCSFSFDLQCPYRLAAHTYLHFLPRLLHSSKSDVRLRTCFSARSECEPLSAPSPLRKNVITLLLSLLRTLNSLAGGFFASTFCSVTPKVSQSVMLPGCQFVSFSSSRG